MDACLRCQAESKKDVQKTDCVVVWGGKFDYNCFIHQST